MNLSGCFALRAERQHDPDQAAHRPNPDRIRDCHHRRLDGNAVADGDANRLTRPVEPDRPLLSLRASSVDAEFLGLDGKEAVCERSTVVRADHRRALHAIKAKPGKGRRPRSKHHRINDGYACGRVKRETALQRRA